MRSRGIRGAMFRRLKALAEKRDIIVSLTDFAAKAPPETAHVFPKLGGLYLGPREGHDPYIWLNPHYALEPIEWVFAHELAHHWQVKHGRVLAPAYWKLGEVYDIAEAEANRFADKLMALLERKHKRAQK